MKVLKGHFAMVAPDVEIDDGTGERASLVPDLEGRSAYFSYQVLSYSQVKRVKLKVCHLLISLSCLLFLFLYILQTT